MRITKQSSGGRGEYEIANNARNGLTPSDLLGRVMNLRFGTHEVKTGVHLTAQGGKRRLRRIDKNTGLMQVQLQSACVLMMPMPVRDERHMEGGQPVLQTGRYIITDIEFGRVELMGDDTFRAEASTLYYANQAYQAETIDVHNRITSIETIWRRRAEFPADIANAIQQHETIVRSGNSIPRNTISLITRLQNQLTHYGDDLGIEYANGTDVVPALIEALDEVVQFQPISLEQIEPEQIELRRREIKRWKQYVSRRGATSIRFKKAVRAAYKSSCIMCGGHFPSTKFNQKPGIDSAHILPWATYDLDKVCNGIALCKLHHWAFDEGLLRITYTNDSYYVELSQDAEQELTQTDFSIDMLRQVVGEIPNDRLPIDPQNRPHPDLLQRLNDEYGT